MQRISSRPLYLLARDALVEKIVSGQWAPGTLLPNENDLSRDMGISLGTIRKALEELERERTIVRRQGRGTFVADHTSSELAIRFSNLRDPSGSHIHGHIRSAESERRPATKIEATNLGIADGAPVIAVKRVRTYHDHAFAWDTAVLPAAMYPTLPADIGSYRITALAQTNRVLLSRAVEQVSADLATVEDARLLDISTGMPILVLDRAVIAENGRVAEWRVARCSLKEKKYVAVTT